MRSAPPWHASLVTRQVVLYSLLTAALIALFGWLSYRGSREALMKSQETALRHAAETVRLKMQGSIRDLMRDVVQLSRSPTLREYLRFEHTPEAPRWKGLVEDAFRASLEGKPDYFQVRLIGVTGDGRELIRLDNNDGFIVAMPPEKLQAKANRDYFQDALRTPGGAVYLSEINLNRDFGRITEPHIPTLRAIKIIENDEGTLHSLLVINVDMRAVFSELTRLVGAAVRLNLANSTGDYLVHPDPARTFGSDLETTARFSADFAPPQTVPTDTHHWRFDHRAGDLVLLARFPFTPESTRHFLLALTEPAEALTADLRAARDRALRLTGIAALAGIAIVVLFARLLAARLRRLTRAVGEYELNRGITGLPAPGNDEVAMLATRFQELDEKVRDSLARMQAAVKAREDFLGVMSHEIRTPMNAVIGLVRALERNAPAPHQAPILKSLGTAANNLMALLDDALDYSKLRAGRMELTRAPVELRQLVGDIVVTHEQMADAKGLILEGQVAAAIPHTVLGDRVRLGQVLHNLVSNAVKFTDEGTITIRLNVHESRVRFAVVDTGMGIPREMLGRVFEPFDQTSPEIAQRFGGTGLGLSITRDLVRLMGGELTVTSSPGEGSVFSFSLALEPAETREISVPRELPSLAGKRLLYIEDVPSNCEVMAHTLAGSGAELITAATGAEGLAALAREDIDVILLDLQLPDTSGIELAPRLRAVKPVPIIAVTAQATPKAREECQAAGIAGIVTKPVDPATLARELTACLGGKISLTGMQGMFGDDPARMQRVLTLLADEFATYEKTIATALATNDRETLRATRHKMHSAVEQLGLTEVRDCLEKLVQGDGVAATEGPRCLAAVAQARYELARKATASVQHVQAP